MVNTSARGGQGKGQRHGVSPPLQRTGQLYGVEAHFLSRWGGRKGPQASQPGREGKILASKWPNCDSFPESRPQPTPWGDGAVVLGTSSTSQGHCDGPGEWEQTPAWQTLKGRKEKSPRRWPPGYICAAGVGVLLWAVAPQHTDPVDPPNPWQQQQQQDVLAHLWHFSPGLLLSILIQSASRLFVWVLHMHIRCMKTYLCESRWTTGLRLARHQWQRQRRRCPPQSECPEKMADLRMEQKKKEMGLFRNVTRKHAALKKNLFWCSKEICLADEKECPLPVFPT